MDVYKYTVKRIQGMDDDGHCLMTEEKNALVGWWRAKREKDNKIIANDRSFVYAFFLMVAIIPFGVEEVPTLSEFISELEESSIFADFTTMFGYYMLLCYGSCMNLGVSRIFVRFTYLRLTTNLTIPFSFAGCHA